MRDSPTPAPCPHRRDRSPESDRAAWCERYAVNLDRAGRLCDRCRTDDAFRDRLRRQHAIRRGASCEPTAWCDIFRTATDADQCRLCTTDPGFRAFLAGQARARDRTLRERRMAGCARRAQPVRFEQRACCGGRKRETPVYHCTLHGEITPDRCAECPAWASPARAVAAPRAT